MFNFRTHNFKLYCSSLLYLPRYIWNLQRCLCPRRKRDDGNGSVWRTNMLLYITLLVENRFKFQRNACCNLLLSFILFCFFCLFSMLMLVLLQILCVSTRLFPRFIVFQKYLLWLFLFYYYLLLQLKNKY